MEIRPLTNKVAVKSIQTNSVTDGGIHLPKAAREQMHRGIVISTGPEVTGVKEGDSVLHVDYAGSPVVIDNKAYLIISECEILAVLTA